MKNLKKLTYDLKRLGYDPKEWGIKSENADTWTIANRKTGEEKVVDK